LTRAEVRARIEEVGIVPAVRVSMPEHATFAAEALHRANIPIAEITMTVPNAIGVIARLARSLPDMVVGAGTVLARG
jgi:2-dehydro-3-deoxyphosphogluconate aldolase / (4S)-4-hydroxy-2-oxoglutarate aldolase